MGRSSSGAVHHFSALKLTMTFLQANTPKNCIALNQSISWNVRGTKTGSIGYDVSFAENGRYLRLKYNHTDRDGIIHPIDYKIQIIGLPSNLGKGENLYFVCPVSYKLCKILYSCYGCKYFMSREAYTHRIYYTSQMYSKSDRVNNYYFELENEIKDLKKKKTKSHYQGIKTRIQNRIERLESKSEIFDIDRTYYLVKDFAKFKGWL